MPSNAEAIALTDVYFAFRTANGEGYRPVLDGVSVHFPYGSICGIAGNNASGKTTLLNVIRGNLTPQRGSVAVDGQLTSAEGRRLRKVDVALVSQNPSVGLAPTMTAFENFVLAEKGFFFDFRPAYRAAARKRCMDVLRAGNMGLEAKIDEQTRFLSGGQQQALSILLSLHNGGRILLLDEPTASLSPAAADGMFQLLRREVTAKHACAVVVSHRAQELIAHCDAIVVLGGGRAAHILHRGIPDWSEFKLSEVLAAEAAARGD